MEKERIVADELWELWPTIHGMERAEWFAQLERGEAEDFFLSLSSVDQSELLGILPEKERKLWVRTLPPDDVADLLQNTDESALKEGILNVLPERTRREISALLAYAEDAAGGLMSPRFARLRIEMTVDEAIAYLRRQMLEDLETMYYCYVLDAKQQLKGVITFADLFRLNGCALIRDHMVTDLVTINENEDQESVAIIFAREDLIALPVVDDNNVMKGIITVDDIVDVVQEEATEDIQKFGGMAALDEPYFQTSVFSLYAKRAGWLVILFFGSLFTTKAMGYYEDAMARAVVLSIYVPLIISTGGNSGSQAATLITRAMALDELRLRDVLKVFRRELIVGSMLGVTLGILGLLRVVLAAYFDASYTDYYLILAIVICLSIMLCVLCGSMFGSMLPFILRFFRIDPATASAPFVATLADVTGVILYFSISSALLTGILL
ncbi:MAG: magnesium transporter [Bradymonadales bacterium]